MRQVRVRLEFQLADCWIGVFAKRNGRRRDVWICVLPCVPLHLTWYVA